MNVLGSGQFWYCEQTTDWLFGVFEAAGLNKLNPRVMQTNPPLSLPTGRENTFFQAALGEHECIGSHRRHQACREGLQGGTDCTHSDVCPKRGTVRWGTSVRCQMLCDDLLVFNLLVYYRLIWLWCVINVWIIKINVCLLSVGWNARYQGSPSLQWRICRERMLAGWSTGGGRGGEKKNVYFVSFSWNIDLFTTVPNQMFTHWQKTLLSH